MALETAYEYRLAIKDELLGRYEELNSKIDIDDFLREIADGWVPVYTHQIIALWSKEMPNEFDDSWKEFGYTEKQGISDLMTIDLFMWLFYLTNELWLEVISEKDGEVA
jgi:hypothetical protein